LGTYADRKTAMAVGRRCVQLSGVATLAISEGGGSHGHRCLLPVFARPSYFLGCNRLIPLDLSGRAPGASIRIRAIAADSR
jgi:hypothetical protein